MAVPAIELTTTSNLSPQQRQQAAELTQRLHALLSPAEEDSIALTIHFRPSLSDYEDKLAYYPEKRTVIGFWSVTPSDDLAAALVTMGTHFSSLALPSPALQEALAGLGTPLLSHAHQVLTYWAGPYTGDEAAWQVRKLAAPGWYDNIQIQDIADFLNRQAPPLGRYMKNVALSYHAYRAGAGPHHGFFQYRREEQLLVIDLPLDSTELPRLLSPPHLQRYTLSASLLAFLYLQADPDIPGLDFPGWIRELETRFRASGFWEEERAESGAAR